MRKLRLFYQNYKEKIWISIGMIALVLVLIRLANNNIQKENEETIENVTSEVRNNISYAPSQSIISDSSISEENAEENINIIENFIDFCNNNQIEEAYNLLSTDCKEELFPTVEDFYNNYYKDIFTEKKSFDTELWGNSGIVTYRIKILSDIMATGIVSDEFIEDYYSIISEDGNKKLNIKNFVSKVEINNKKSIEDIEFNVLNKKTYIDYKIVEVEIKNNSDKKVIIDTKENTESVYIRDMNGVGYGWYGHEIADNLLDLEPGESTNLEIKFNKMYNTNRKDKTIHFTDIHKEGMEETLSIEIGI